MFSGIIQTIGEVTRIEPTSSGARLTIQNADLPAKIGEGDSVAVNGTCLTVVGFDEESFWFDAVPETLAKTNLVYLQPGHRVNLESSLAVGDQIHGHFVQGHVDSTGVVQEISDDGGERVVWFQFPHALRPLLAPKGSIAVDGISLTLVDVTVDRFSVALIPYTLSHTIAGEYRVGQQVNLETDMLGKHVFRCLQHLTSDSSGAAMELLKNAGLV